MKNFANLPLPDGLSQKEITQLLLREEYGFLPPAPTKVTVEQTACDSSFCAGKAQLLTLNFICEIKGTQFSFPVYYTKTAADRPTPCFIHINFKSNVPDRYQPTEELVDRGYSVLSFCYTDVSSDDGDFTNGLAGLVFEEGKREPYDCGKIGLWAWAALRVLDYAVTLKELDSSKISVVGHSRLGKTALLAGALDPRFYCAFSNNSGCCGAAISRQNTGETLEKIMQQFPFWFCENFKKYVAQEDTLPFDQHFLLAANAPHRVYVASAAEDSWACPENEYGSCLLAAPYFGKNGLKTFLTAEMPKVGSGISKGYIGYHIRAGKHYLSREDWIKFINFLAP